MLLCGQSNVMTFYKLFLVPLILLISVSQSWSTIRPTLEEMVRESDFVILGKIIAVERPGEAKRTVHVKTISVFKGESTQIVREFKFEYARVGKGNIDFHNLLQLSREGGRQIIFIKKSEANTFILTSGWFGVRTPSSQLINEIENLVGKGT